MKEKQGLKELDPIEMGRRIRKQRELKHLTREELADMLGISVKFLSDIEYGDKGISIKNLLMLSQLLNVSTDYILAGKEEEQSKEKEKRDYLTEDIKEALNQCSTKQLECLEQIVKFYMEAVKEK